MNPPTLSVVVPAYNEETRIHRTLMETLGFLSKGHPDHEILVVDDGSSDGTAGVVAGVEQEHPTVRLLQLDRNRGKGAAVRRGMLEAKADYLLFMDADLSTPIEEVDRLLEYARGGVDVVVGSRALDGSDIRVRQPRFREVMGRTFNFLVRSALLGGFHDTQCGFKVFRRQAAQELFSKQTLEGFAFDVEILLLAKQLGYVTKEVPVIWRHEDNSKVSPLSDSTKMFTDLVRLRLKSLLP